MPPHRHLTEKRREVLAVLVVVLAIYQRQRVLQYRAMEYEGRSYIYEPPITYIHQHGWTMDNLGDHFFHDVRDFIEFLRY